MTCMTYERLGSVLRTSRTHLWFKEKSKTFFFQAEDGIRDGTVTGVQTCALPIWPAPGSLRRPARADRLGLGRDSAAVGLGALDADIPSASLDDLDLLRRFLARHHPGAVEPEIGRASCRERV